MALRSLFLFAFSAFFAPFFIPGNEFRVFGGTSLPTTIKEVLNQQMAPPYFPVKTDLFGSKITYHDVKPGDVISVRPKSKNLQLINETLESYSTSKYKWLETDKKSKTGKFLNLPVMEEIPENINVQLIIELYSK